MVASHESRIRSIQNEIAAKPLCRKTQKACNHAIRGDVLDYFKEMAEKTGVPYQTLINLYLRDCMANKREIDIRWD